MSRVALGVEYDGTAYCGWQIQPHAPSIQATLNAAISVVANQPTTCVGAGRTDTGVHATGQVVHFRRRRRTGAAILAARHQFEPAG